MRKGNVGEAIADNRRRFAAQSNRDYQTTVRK